MYLLLFVSVVVSIGVVVGNVVIVIVGLKHRLRDRSMFTNCRSFFFFVLFNFLFSIFFSVAVFIFVVFVLIIIFVVVASFWLLVVIVVVFVIHVVAVGFLGFFCCLCLLLYVITTDVFVFSGSYFSFSSWTVFWDFEKINALTENFEYKISTCPMFWHGNFTRVYSSVLYMDCLQLHKPR